MPATSPETLLHTSPVTTERFYLPQLDILRFFAFLAVFIGDSFPGDAESYQHFGVPHVISVVMAAAVNCGPFGVDLFFVLSSYLITTLLLREMQVVGKVDTVAFYLRRALRIWPLYFFFLFGYFFLQGSIPHGRSQQPLTGMQLVPFVLFVGNFEIMRHPFLQIVHLWSVSIEEQFYITWALVMRWVKVTRLPLLAIIAIMVSVASRAYLQYNSAGKHPGMVFVSILCNTATRLDCLAMGVLVATGAVFAWRLRWPRLWIAASIAVLIAMEMVLPREVPGLPNAAFTYLIIAVACAMLVRASLDCRPGKGVITRAFTYLGKISFGLYVYSPIAMAFAWRWVRKDPIGATLIHPAIAIALTIGVAVLSFELIERRFLKMKQRFTYVLSRPA